MPKDYDINEKFEVYKSVCCGAEIVIPSGTAFPDCPNHPRLPTEWKPLEDDRIRHVSELFPKKNPNNDAA